MRLFARAQHVAPLILLVALAACKENGGGSNAPLAATVTVSDNAFTPASVTIRRTGTVTWNWTGGPHNVTFSDATSSDRLSGQTYARAFNNAGSFSYQCTVHPTIMTGTVVVE